MMMYVCLCVQARAGSAACCKLLIQGAADSNFKDSYLRTPVHIAAQLGAVVCVCVRVRACVCVCARA